MNEHSEDALAKAAALLGEHFAEFVIICAQKQSREPIIEHSGSIFSATGLTEAAVGWFQASVSSDEDKDDGDNWQDDDEFTGGDPKIPA